MYGGDDVLSGAVLVRSQSPPIDVHPPIERRFDPQLLLLDDVQSVVGCLLPHDLACALFQLALMVEITCSRGGGVECFLHLILPSLSFPAGSSMMAADCFGRVRAEGTTIPRRIDFTMRSLFIARWR